MKKIILFLFSVICIRINAQVIDITPAPVKSVLQKGNIFDHKKYNACTE